MTEHQLHHLPLCTRNAFHVGPHERVKTPYHTDLLCCGHKFLFRVQVLVTGKKCPPAGSGLLLQ